MNRPWCVALLLASLGLAEVAHAAPVERKIEILRTRPTGMEVEAWKKKRREIARELGDVRSDAAVDALIEIVETERYDAVLSIAIDSLAEQGDPRALPALQKVHADRSIDTFIREQARKAIEALGGTPKDDARWVAGEGADATVEGRSLPGPQLGAMGEASVADEPYDSLEDVPELPSDLRARDREIAFVLGDLSAAVNAPLRSPGGNRDVGNPVLADIGLGAMATYLDERQRWGWTASGLLSVDFQNGDLTPGPSPDGDDDGDTIYVRQALEGDGDVHLYFGDSDVHGFVAAAVSQRVTHAEVEDIEGTGPDEGNLSDTRFAIDLVPAAGLGWGRYLNAGTELLVDALQRALEAENILTRPLDAETRRAVQQALYAEANAFSSYPRLARVLSILQAGGFLARRPGPRLIHRLRSILEDPSFLQRMQGIRVRVGFLYDVTLAQDDFYLREGDDVGAPMLQLQSGFQLDRERELLGDVRFWYDAIGPLQGFTTDVGARYARFLHGRYDDYRGQWHVGLRGGVSQRQYAADVDGDGNPDRNDLILGYRAVARVGYAYGFRRGSEIALTAHAGVDSSRFIAGLGLRLRFGVMRGSVWHGASTPARGDGKPAAR